MIHEGHAASDRVLMKVAKRQRNSVVAVIQTYRLGDEFCDGALMYIRDMKCNGICAALSSVCRPFELHNGSE